MNKSTIISLAIGVLIGIIIGSSYIETFNPKTLNQSSSNEVSQKQLELKLNMRKLWEDHVSWTRMYIESVSNDNPDSNNIAMRLLKNQEDIGNAIKPYYGEGNGNKLTSLLKEHILTAQALVNAAKSNDQSALDEANTKWYDNANQIADFLSSANPNWKKDQTRQMMKEHLDLTKQEAVDILEGNFDAGITGYDKINNQILEMADQLSNGIIKQFPEKF